MKEFMADLAVLRLELDYSPSRIFSLILESGLAEPFLEIEAAGIGKEYRFELL
jgi:hypothetical protein